jgi:UDP-glucose 4-epimerase
MSSYLVTGGAGFIGAAVASRLLAAGHEVVVVDNLSTGYAENVPAGAAFVEGALQDAALYARLPRREYAAIYHIAGQSSGEISFDDPVYDLQTNTQSTLLLLKLALDSGCRRILYASTMSVYGEQPGAPVAEDAATAPKSFYGVGKLASEHYLRIYRQYGIEGACLRLFNVYGPGQNMANLRQGMVSIYLAHALQNRHIHVKGSAERYRDLVYIDDVVDAFIALETARLGASPVYNVCTGVRTTVGGLIERLRAALPFEVGVRYEGSTPGDMFGITGDGTRIAREVGWRAQVGLDDGLARMVAWALGGAPAARTEAS